jgi:hypothetical protein
MSVSVVVPTTGRSPDLRRSLDAMEARTVTGHCALRRDRLPAGVRYDEERLPLVGEDVGFGDALRAIGFGFQKGCALIEFAVQRAARAPRR